MFIRLHPSNPWHGTETEAPDDETRTLELQDLWPHLALLCAGLALAAAAFSARRDRAQSVGAAHAQMGNALRALLRRLVPAPKAQKTPRRAQKEDRGLARSLGASARAQIGNALRALLRTLVPPPRPKRPWPRSEGENKDSGDPGAHFTPVSVQTLFV